MKTYIIITVIAVYLISALATWAYLHKAYSRGGRFDRIKPGLDDIAVTTFPVLNTIAAIYLWSLEGFDWCYDKFESKGYTIEKTFFRIKK